LLALRQIAPREIIPEQAHGGPSPPDHPPASFRSLLKHRSLLILACCVALFHLANAAMLPLMGSTLTSRSSDWATIMIATCIVVPQLVVALIAPWAGRQARIWGRRPIVLLGFGTLAVRGLLFSVVTDPAMIVAVQILDGISAVTLGVMVPLIVADITRGSGRFNSALGVVGMIAGIGAATSTTLAGAITDAIAVISPFSAWGLSPLWPSSRCWPSFPKPGHKTRNGASYSTASVDPPSTTSFKCGCSWFISPRYAAR